MSTLMPSDTATPLADPFAGLHLPTSNRPLVDPIWMPAFLGVLFFLAPIGLLMLISRVPKPTAISASENLPPPLHDATARLLEEEWVSGADSKTLRIRRRDCRSEAELRQELASMPELIPGPGLAAYRRYTLIGLPDPGLVQPLDREVAWHFETMARQMRGCLRETARAEDQRAALERQLRSDPIWQDANAVGCLMQMLQPECRPIRQALVAQLHAIAGPRASSALAKLAVFDLSGAVRAEALTALRDRPASDYRPVLLAGLQHPWAAAADHAAEALVALNDTEALPDLRRLETAAEDAKVYEVVRLNHLRNCMSCHAGAKDTNQPLRGAIPTPGKPLPPNEIYYSFDGPAIRADITFVRQDFSATLPVDHAYPWPSQQRFDFVVRARYPLPGELTPPSNPQRQALAFVLRELGNQGERGPSAGERGASAP